ncbi:MAG: hypothetical protein ACJ79O_26945 [Myxococcales bacterium]
MKTSVCVECGREVRLYSRADLEQRVRHLAAVAAGDPSKVQVFAAMGHLIQAIGAAEAETDFPRSLSVLKSCLEVSFELGVRLLESHLIHIESGAVH